MPVLSDASSTIKIKLVLNNKWVVSKHCRQGLSSTCVGHAAPDGPPQNKPLQQPDHDVANSRLPLGAMQSHEQWAHITGQCDGHCYQDGMPCAWLAWWC